MFCINVQKDYKLVYRKAIKYEMLALLSENTCGAHIQLMYGDLNLYMTFGFIYDKIKEIIRLL